MYLEYFGLKTKPFELVPNPDFLFPSVSHRLALSHLEYGLQSRAGFILLTGEVGSGKTTLIREILRRQKSESVLALVFNTSIDADQLLALVNEDFGLDVKGKGKIDLLRDLNDFLIEQHRLGKHPVLIVDEAQNLAPEVLEEIRLLSNLEAESFKLLQIVLVGQPELKERLALPELRQLRQRLGVRCHLQPLTVEETREYILHRLECAGDRHAVLFTDGTIEVIHRYSGGIPRLINVFCDFLLLAACVEETRELSLELVEDVVGEIAEDSGFAKAQKKKKWTGPGEWNELFRRMQVYERTMKRVFQRQRQENARLQASLDRIAGLLESLPERMQAGGCACTENTPSEKVVKFRC